MTKSQTQTQTNDDVLPMNARLFKKNDLLNGQQLVLVIEKRFLLCDKNIDFFKKLIATSLMDANAQLLANVKIDFNDKTKAILVLKEFGVEFETPLKKD